MKRNDGVIDVLNDLVLINNDRIEGYRNAISNLKDGQTDLINTFQRMINESEMYKNELRTAIRSNEGEVTDDSTTNSGKIYRLWMDIKSAFTSKTRGEENVLELCEYGEDAAQKAYEKALESEDTTGSGIRELILRQKNQLLQSHNMIKEYRDREKAAH